MLNMWSFFRLYLFTLIDALELHSKSTTRLRVERDQNGSVSQIQLIGAAFAEIETYE